MVFAGWLMVYYTPWMKHIQMHRGSKTPGKSMSCLAQNATQEASSNALGVLCFSLLQRRKMKQSMSRDVKRKRPILGLACLAHAVWNLLTEAKVNVVRRCTKYKVILSHSGKSISILHFETMDSVQGCLGDFCDNPWWFVSLVSMTKALPISTHTWTDIDIYGPYHQGAPLFA